MIEQKTDYFAGNELAWNVWNSKYALRKDGKQLETVPDEMHMRMAEQFARVELSYPGLCNRLNYNQIFEMLSDFSRVIPQGSVMALLGNPNQIGSLSNCVVLPKIYDSYGGILYTDQQLAQVMKRRCGAGIDISTLRTFGSFVSNAAQTSTGAVSFMPRFSHTTREVAQDGRRGALMISMDIRHPESELFALSKQDLSKITGANISLKIVDEFMECVKKNQKFAHRFPVESDNIVKVSDAKALWDVIIKAARNTAEPGLIYWDRQHYYSPSSLYREFCNISTNPCSEIAMGNDTCRLIALNLFASIGMPFTKDATFDFEDWYWTCYNGMRLMDDLVDLELERMQQILTKIDSDDEPDHIKQVERQTWKDLANSTTRGRRTGLGFTALGDTIAALGYKYDSDDAINFVEQMMRVKLCAELDSTIDMAEERGCFPAFDAELEEVWSQDERTFYYMIKNEFPNQWERMQLHGRRNISWSTLAPTGSLSLLTKLDGNHFGTTSGVEPVFKISHIRKKKINPNDANARVDETDAMGDRWQYFNIVHEGFKMWYELNHGPAEELETMSKEQLELIVALSPYHRSTAEEIDWKKRIEIQAIIQKYTTHSISSTINLPNNVSEKEVSDIYFAAWEQGLKGITIYRDGSRSGVLVSEAPKQKEFAQHHAPKRPKDLECDVFTTVSKGTKYNVFVGLLGENPYEVFATPYFANLDKAVTRKEGKGSYTLIDSNGKEYENFLSTLTDEEAAITRLISTSLRHGADIKYVVEQLGKVEGNIVGFVKAIKRVLNKYVPEQELLKTKCKDCGSENLKFEEGCSKCLDCGSSKCG